MSPAHAVAIRDVRYHSISALAFLVWQAILTFDEEVQYIWAMHNKNPFKWTYFYLRYAVIVVHAIHNYLIEHLANGSNPPMLCDVWRVYIIVFSQSLATLLECILGFRVFALYNRSRRVVLLLSVLILTELVGAMRVLWLQGDMTFHGVCLLVQLSHSSRDQTVIGFMVHCTLISLTLFKYFAASRAGWGRTPLVSLLIRDGSTVYATKFFIVLSVLLLFGTDSKRGISVFFWATALISNVGCYLVVSMERLARKEIPTDPPEAVFTSEISMAIYTSSDAR